MSQQFPTVLHQMSGVLSIQFRPNLPTLQLLDQLLQHRGVGRELASAAEGSHGQQAFLYPGYLVGVDEGGDVFAPARAQHLIVHQYGEF